MLCTDTDLLYWEPALPAEAIFASQTLLDVDAAVSGTTLTIASGSLSAAHVKSGYVAVLSGAITGCYPIVSVDSDTTMTLSVIHEGLPNELASVGVATEGLNLTVRTYWAQRHITSEMLTWMSGVVAGTGGRILNPEVLRKPCVLGTLHMIYNAMAVVAPAEQRADLIIRSELYEQLYRKSLRGVYVELDLNGDGVLDDRRPLRLVQFARL